MRASERLARIFGTSHTPRGDVGLALVVAAFAALLLWQAAKVPPPFFDPLGSAAVPRGVAVVLLLLAAIVLVRALLARPWPALERDTGYRRRPDVACGIVALAVAYVGVMAAGVLGFMVATILFLALGTALLATFRRRQVLIGLALAVVLGIGGTLLFTEFFFIDLPR
ncbi:tripartite tricarboxylate transporter TctB family protein [Acuticoccus mangrovi]|uniref:Tripartite tricarboxylate transporter TctB family protein n=1 Tax=Acuticoccus mangrovi TaxID=2796142 RepID=A0A934MER0_9HYPH|nr:tripartite tricarboxylate transporter TctB family protein [Acuticoccus mangrovi]MBJ3774643.1 tripartite tricarboxylate transporter TctB family protein [Acuticoccus mangrovi]